MAKKINAVLRAALAAVAASAGCEVGPNYAPPQVVVLRDWGEQGLEPTTQPTDPSQRTSRTVTRPISIVEWWTTFHDPVLDSLIQRAMEQNLDLQLATARLREARAERRVVRADLAPQVDVDGSYQHARASQNGFASAFGQGGGVSTGGGGRPPGANGSPAIPGGTIDEFDLHQAGFDASWEIDVFGGRRRAVEAANADIEAANERRRAVLTTLLGDVARTYLELRESQRRLVIARDNVTAQNRTVQLTREQVGRGLISELDLFRAEAQVAATSAQIPSLEAQTSRAVHQLSTLLGLRPTALATELQVETAVPTPPDEVPIGLPSELLRRRPDVRQAEREAAAATARIGVAVADLFPKFSLTGTAGLQSIELKDLASWNSRFYSFGPGVSWPIFDAGRIRGRIAVQEARHDQSIISYRQIVLRALTDVEDALVSYGAAQDRLAALRRAATAEQKAVRIARDLYQQGLSDFLTVLDAERSLYSAEDAQAAGESEVAVALVALYKALGGGWEVAEPRPQSYSTIETVEPSPEKQPQ